MADKAGAAVDAAKEAVVGPEVGKMKRGDYMIHIFIEQAKNIRLEGAGTVDPMVEVTSLDVKKYSSTKNDIGPTGIVQWSEHLFFEYKRLEVDEIESGKISIRILNKGFFKEEQIGVYEFDITQIYFMKDHTLFHQWLGLSNPEGKDFNEITSYLKLSISIAGPGDEQVQLAEDVGGVEGTDSAVVLMPSSIKKQYKQLYFKIFKAEKLPIMDRFGTIDAYLTTTFFKQSLKTTVVTMKDNLVQWDQEMWLPVQWPVASNRLVFKLYDYDSAGSDELVGSMIFSIKDIVASGLQTFRWLNLYGAPIGYSGDNTDKMNNNPEFASTWKGRLLLQYYAEDTKHPEMKIQTIPNQIKQEAAAWLKMYDYEIIAEVGSAICLPESKKYKIKVAINDFSFITDAPIEAKENYCRWNKRFDIQKLTAVYSSLDELDRVYVYLMDGDKPVCFWKGRVKDFENPDPEFKWLPFSPDLSIGSVKDGYKAGLFQFKMTIVNRTLNGAVDFKQFNAWKKPPPKRLSSWKVRCYIYQCKDLPAADSEGNSDPYIEIWTTDKNKPKTLVVEDNCNPIFFSTLEMYYDFSSPAEAPPIVLNIWDKDEGVFDGDDFIGRAIIFLKDANFSEDDTVPLPKWHKVTMGFQENEPSMGEILVSFSLVPDDYRFKVPTEYFNVAEQLVFKEYNIEINVLGLRMLQSVGLLPVKKPFIKFNLRSLLPPEKAKAVQNVQTNPQDTGPNPNINTTVSFIMNLPESALFCPKLSCDVYDMVFKGFVQPTLGTFSIEIGEILDETKANQADEILEANHIINELKKILSGGGQAMGRSSTSKLLNEGQQEEIKEGVGSALGPILEEERKSLIDKGGSPRDLIKVEPEDARMVEKLGHSGVKRRVGGNMGAAMFRQSNIIKEVMEQKISADFYKEKINKDLEQKYELANQRLQDIQNMKAGGQKSYKNVIMPQYAFDERLKMYREIDPPPSSLFVGLGFNQNHEEAKKHYRRYYPDELENVKEVIPKKPFHECIIRRGQSRGASAGMFSWFSKANTDDAGQVSTVKEVGKFKGIINVYNSDEAEQFKAQRKGRNELIRKLIRDIHEKKVGQVMAFDFERLENAEDRAKFALIMDKIGCAELNLGNYLLETGYQEQISKMMVAKTKCLMRVYFIEGFDFSQRDIGSFSDPYLKITCGKKVYNDRDNYQLDQPHPKFHKHFDFDVEFPGAPPLVVEAYDFDDLFGDDLIGTTVVDLDDRFFSPEWQSIKEKPVEYRQLRHPSSTVSQGVIKMWVEINPTAKSTGDDKTYDIVPRPTKEYEVRLVVWDTKDIIAQDVEGTSDIYIRAFFDTKDSKETDCHYRCQNGKGSFNYRLLYTMKAPCDNYKLTLQAWDRDFFKSNDLIGDGTLDLKALFSDVIETGRTISLNKKYYNSYFEGVLPSDQKLKFQDEDSFWLPVRGIDEKTKEIKDNGFIRVSITVMSKETADANKVGDARSEPNHSPFLPPPTGRLSFSLNPFTMFNQLVGPEVRRKVYTICCCTLCCLVILSLIPLVFSNIISFYITKML